MDLMPKLLPGRANRKAKAFTAQIQRLRSAGYTFEAIRLALLEAGVDVSRATVKREADKCSPVGRVAMPARWPGPVRRAPPPSSPSSDPSVDVAGLGVLSEPSLAGRSCASDLRGGKAIAEAYVQDQITNPLLRQRVLHQNRSD